MMGDISLEKLFMGEIWSISSSSISFRILSIMKSSAGASSFEGDIVVPGPVAVVDDGVGEANERNLFGSAAAAATTTEVCTGSFVGEEPVSAVREETCPCGKGEGVTF
jgi:hypothetical protein